MRYDSQEKEVQVMASLVGIRTRLQNRIFNKIGSTATLTPFTSQTSDKWGDPSVTWGTPVTITIVPFEYAKTLIRYDKGGDTKTASVITIVPYSQAIGVNDKITYDGADYKVLEIDSFTFQGGELAKQVRCAKILA